MLFRRWAQALHDAEVVGENAPGIQDVDAVVDWLDERDMIEHPVDREQARVLIEACLKGGMLTVAVT